MATKKKNENTNLVIGVLIGVVIVLGFFAFQPMYWPAGYKIAWPAGMQNMMGSGQQMMPTNNMMYGMMGNNMMSGQHTDANSDGKCDMCGMRLDDCKRMMGGV